MPHTRLTPAQHEALTAARDAGAKGLQRKLTTTGWASWPAHPSTLRALTRHGLLRRNDTTWHITPTGEHALELAEHPTPPRPPRHAPHFLAPQARAGNGLGYLTQPTRPLPLVADPPDLTDKIRSATAMCDEPEAIGPAIINAQADLARTYDRLRHHATIQQAEQTRRLLKAEHRIADAQRRAKRQHIDVSHEIRIVQKMLDRARRSNRQQAPEDRQDPPAAIARLERIEARLDHRPDLENAA